MTYIVAVLDVESMGLYGREISYGIVIGDNNGNVIEEIYKYYDYDYELAYNQAIESRMFGDIEWIEENVKPHLGESNASSLTFEFYIDWLNIKDKYPGIKLFADVPFPVETNFISHVVNDEVSRDNIFEFSPYPLLDVTSFRLAHNLPDYYERLDNELPIHNALNDARQSYRGLVEVIKDE